LQAVAAGRHQRQRERGGFDELPAGSGAVAHNGLARRALNFSVKNLRVNPAKHGCDAAGLKSFFMSHVLMTFLILNFAYSVHNYAQ
jgi:hypothetical protein